MLRYLYIQNYALIEKISIDFSERLNIITGETGAGKSIIVGALGLVLGERADLSVLYTKAGKCVVEAIFKNSNPEIATWLLAQELDNSEEVVVRREINSSGKSRAFINDTPVTLSQLKMFSSLLVDLHQQFDTLEVGDNDFQQRAIDAIAGNASLLANYQAAFRKYQLALKDLRLLQERQAAAAGEYDYKKFLFDELEEAAFSDGEIEKAEAEIKLLSSAEQIKSTLGEIVFFLQEAETPVINQLKVYDNKLAGLAKVHEQIEELSKRLHSTYLELQDISGELEKLSGEISHDAARIDQLNNRISEGYRLLKKHNVNDTAGLLHLRDNLSAALENTLNLETQISEKQKQLETLRQACYELAEKLSTNRNAQTNKFEQHVNKLLAQVGMPNARIVISIQPLPQLNEFGRDDLQFLFNANIPATANTEAFVPLRKVASGGELSRVMLSIKSLIAESIALPTLIFDEIDSGISGEAAKQVGAIMRKLSANHQIISITHQPQIASKADRHFYVFKELKGEKIVTAIKLLNDKERIDNIAMMLSGKSPSAAAFANAKEMIGN